tara:strand:- start:1688 stop:3370 length:1683 start_codon:yes stop_codon:yes gene_type:complete
MVLDMEVRSMACRVIMLLLSWVLAQAAIGESRWNTPWVELSDQAEWIDGEGEVGTLHRAAVAMDDGSSMLFLSAPGEPTRASLRPGDGTEGVIVPQTMNLAGTILDADEMPDGRFIVLLHDTIESSPTHGDLILWIGTMNDIQTGGDGQYTARLESVGDLKPIRGRFYINQDAVVMRIQADFDGEQPRRFQALPIIREMDARVPTRGYDIPLIDLDQDAARQVIVDREPGQYLGHPTTVLLEDGKTMLCVYPKGHGKGGVCYKRSDDGGLSWSERLPVPENWESSREVPTLHRVIDPKTGEKRLLMWSGLYPARTAVSEDDGLTWSPLSPVGDWGGIVVMGFVERLSDGRYLAMFHDDGRFIHEGSQQTSPVTFTMYKTFSEDGGLTWSAPESVWSGQDVHLCEPGVIRSPDGSTLAILLRENSRRRNSYIMFSDDEGDTWSAPRELPAALTGDRHTGVYAPDGRLFISFRDTTHESPTKGDWVAWVGTWDDLEKGTSGQYRVRLKDNKHAWDTAYPGVELLPDGTIVTTTYGHWDEGESPYIRSVRLKLSELDEMAQQQ